MSTTTIVNGAPLTYLLGIQDLSTRALAVQADVLPSHLPKVYLYAQKGPSTPQLVVGNGRNQLYGDDTFDLRKPFTTHQTVLSNVVDAQGNAQMIERIIPADAGPKANFLLSLDVLETTIPQYDRDTTGAVMLDSTTGLPVLASPAASLSGFKAKWVVTSVTANPENLADSQLFGVAATGPGDQTDGATQSVRYPVLEFWANSQGAYFNDVGFRIYAPLTTSTGGVNTALMASNKVYPFRMAAIQRSSSASSAAVVLTEAGAPFFDFTLKPGQINPATDAQVSLQDIFLPQFQTTGSTAYADKFGNLNGLHIYQANIDLLTAQFYAAEKTNLNASSDFTGADAESYLFNLFSGTSSTGVAYYTYVVDGTALNATRLTESTNLFAAGGADGTMNETLFAGLVTDKVSGYADPNSYLLDIATQPESIIYDTGFPLATKYALCKFIAERKDTAVVLSTYDVNGQTLSAAEDHSVAIALRTRLQMYPESDYFGTSVVRGVIIGRSGTLIGSQYTKKLPLTIELADKAAKMMGSGDGIWKTNQLFDMAPNSVISLFSDVSVAFTPAQQRTNDWSVGLNYPVSYTRKTLYFPAIKTVYDNDTSVLNSFFAMSVCQELQKIGQRTHRNFSGVVSLTNAQLIDRVNKDVLRQAIGRFAGLAQVVPNAYISDGDAQRGYSWSLKIAVYLNNMKTAMTLSLPVYRMTDYVATV